MSWGNFFLAILVLRLFFFSRFWHGFGFSHQWTNSTWRTNVSKCPSSFEAVAENGPNVGVAVHTSGVYRSETVIVQSLCFLLTGQGSFWFCPLGMPFHIKANRPKNSLHLFTTFWKFWNTSLSIDRIFFTLLFPSEFSLSSLSPFVQRWKYLWGTNNKKWTA